MKARDCPEGKCTSPVLCGLRGKTVLKALIENKCSWLFIVSEHLFFCQEGILRIEANCSRANCTLPHGGGNQARQKNINDLAGGARGTRAMPTQAELTLLNQ